MDFSLSEEQRLLKDGADRFIRESYDYETRRKLAASKDGFSRDYWRTFAELGWLALPFSEGSGGLGGGAVDVMLLMEAMGRGLALEPYLAAIVMAGGLIERAGTADQKRDYLSRLMDGSALSAFAFAESQGRYDLADVETLAEIDGKGYRLHGRKSVVLHGAAADFLIVLARTSGATRDERGLTLFLVEKDRKGLGIQTYRTIDGGRAAEISLEDVPVERSAIIGPEDGALPIVEAVIDRATAALCAESVGVLEASVEATRSYMGQRKQFGAPLAAFQALQHRLADMVVGLEQVKSLAAVANVRCDGDDPIERARAVSAAKAEVIRNGAFIVANAVQLHGGMGVSEELNVGAWFKRQHAINALFGDRAFHIRRHRALAA